MSTISDYDSEKRPREIRESGKELTTKAIVNHARFRQQEKVREETRQTGQRTIRQMGHEDRIKIVHGDFKVQRSLYHSRQIGREVRKTLFDYRSDSEYSALGKIPCVR